MPSRNVAMSALPSSSRFPVRGTSPADPSEANPSHEERPTAALVISHWPAEKTPGVATPSPFQSASSGMPSLVGILTRVRELPDAPGLNVIHKPFTAEPAAGTERGCATPISAALGVGRVGNAGALLMRSGAVAAWGIGKASAMDVASTSPRLRRAEGRGTESLTHGRLGQRAHGKQPAPRIWRQRHGVIPWGV